jgi:hypothetical protein
MREILRGDLEVLNLASVLQLIEAEAVTGRMSFDQGAEILFKHGQLVSATIGQRRGLQAVEEMFLTPMATFVLSQVEVQEERVLGMMTGVIMSGLRLSDEWARLSPLVLGPRPDRVIQDAALLALVRQMDGARTFVEVVQAAGTYPVAAIDPVVRGLDEGLLREVSAPAPERAKAALNPPGAEEYYPLIDEGRTHLKLGQLAEAEAAFRRAQLARPDDRLAEQNLRRVLQLKQQRA